MFRRVLIPLDGSEASAQLLGRLPTIVPPGVREFLLLHVAPEVCCVQSHDWESVERAVEVRRDQLSRQASELDRAGVTARPILRRAHRAAEEIVQTAVDEGADLIAMTKRRFSEVARILLGSVADEVVRRSPVPVLLVKAGARSGPASKILIPLDGSERSLHILPAVQKMARGFGSRATVLYVSRGVDDSPHVVERAERELRKRGVEAGTAVRFGDPAEQIVAFGRSGGYDLVAMCTHGRTGFDRWLLGSVTERVLRSADVPVLVMRNVPIGPAIYANRRAARAQAGWESRAHEFSMPLNRIHHG